MTENRVKSRSSILTIQDSDGDGALLSLIPAPAVGVMRKLVQYQKSQRQRRLMRVAEKIYTLLQKIEERVLPGDKQELHNISFPDALQDDIKVERSLRLFNSAWRTGLIQLTGKNADPIPPEKPRSFMMACGMTVADAQTYFIDLAVRSIFRKNPKALEKVIGTIHSPDDLPKARVLSQFEPLALTEIVVGLGKQTGNMLSEMAPDQLYALASLKSYHLRAMRVIFRAGFRSVFSWNPKVIQGIATSFQCVEQLRDLGEALGMIQQPESLEALGRWDIRDITDLINQERAKAGKEKLKGRRFETDIGMARRILGEHFNTMVEKPPAVLDAFGIFIRSLRDLDSVTAQERVAEVRQFCERYLEYLDGDTMEALGLTGSGSTPYSEAFYILEGLFSKPGLGRKFFEGPFQTPDGIQAISGLRKDIEDMRARGSLKGFADVTPILANSDILDRHIAKFLGIK